MLLKKYRPKRFNLVVGRKKILTRVRGFVARKDLPNLLFHGKPGVGKSLIAELIARSLYADSWKMNFFQLNASDETGIDAIRTKVKKWAKLKTLDSGDVGFKIIFLDEADYLTPNSQAALRRIMEDHFAVCRFILACNYLHKIILPLRSRSSLMHFGPIPRGSIRKFLRYVNKREEGKLTEKILTSIIDRCNGDMRQALNLMELALKGERFPEKVTDLLKMRWKEFAELAYKQDSSMLLEQMHKEALELSDHRMIIKIAEADRDIARGATKVIQLQSLFIQLQEILEE